MEVNRRWRGECNNFPLTNEYTIPRTLNYGNVKVVTPEKN